MTRAALKTDGPGSITELRPRLTPLGFPEEFIAVFAATFDTLQRAAEDRTAVASIASSTGTGAEVSDGVVEAVGKGTMLLRQAAALDRRGAASMPWVQEKLHQQRPAQQAKDVSTEETFLDG